MATSTGKGQFSFQFQSKTITKNVQTTTQLHSSHMLMQETWVRSLGWEDPLEKETGNPHWYSCLENPMDREARQATVHAVAKS